MATSNDRDPADPVMENIRGTYDALNVRRVFGDAYEVDGVTVIPVAKVAGGAGGGGGQGTHDEDTGHGFGTKALFALIRTASRQPVLDIIKLVKYRPEYYGRPMSLVTQEAMRGPSEWTVAEREMMASYVSKVNECEF